MALFGRDYDSDYGRDFNRGGLYGSNYEQNRYRGSQRGPSDSWSGSDDRGNYGSMRGPSGAERYDRTYSSRGGYGSDYDRNYKSQWQTDHGDPFGDRESNTPMRVIRGEYHSRGHRGDDSGWFGRDRNRYDSGWFGNDRDRDDRGGWFGRDRERSDRGGWFGGGRNRYESDYSSNPMGYDPYRSRENSMERGWGMRGDPSSRYGRDFRDDRY